MLNSWKIAHLKEVKLPEDAEKAFKEVTGKYRGMEINTPVLYCGSQDFYCGSQATRGINHMIIYINKPTPQMPPMVDEKHRYLCQIIINSFEGEYSVISNIVLMHEFDDIVALMKEKHSSES